MSGKAYLERLKQNYVAVCKQVDKSRRANTRLIWAVVIETIMLLFFVIRSLS